jgi:four helix bundle protein
MLIQRFEEILAWQKAKSLYLEIRREFKGCRDYDFLSQLYRSALSISNNIAEGFERRTNNEFRCFLYISKGSCGEVRSILGIAVELKYISQQDYRVLSDKSEEISKIFSGLIKNLRKST